MNTVIDALASHVVGTVESVSADRIVVLLDPDTPQATALNTGSPAGFPRINGYLLIPNESGATVGVVTKVEIERLPYPKRRGMQDFGLVDLPFPARKILLTPLGTLVGKLTADGAKACFEVRRGVDVFPSVGDPVHLPADDHLRAIVEGESAETTHRILLGHCPTAANAPVYVDPDKLFGRHLAVLGNTGAGKSCSVAGLIRWSLEAATAQREQTEKRGNPNARFIVLDPNGEYARAFDGLGARIFQVEPEDKSKAQPLKVPAWLWNGEEWAAFTGAQPGVQRPVLFEALRRLKAGLSVPTCFEARVSAVIRPYRDMLTVAHINREYLTFPGCKNVVLQLESMRKEIQNLAQVAAAEKPDFQQRLKDLVTACQEAENGGRVGKNFNPIDAQLIQTVLDQLNRLAADLGIPTASTVSEDCPRPFKVEDLPRFVAGQSGLMPGRDISQWVDTLNLRISGLFEGRLREIVIGDKLDENALADWLGDHIGDNQASNAPLTILDMSLVPSEVIHIVIAVLARMVFEAVQRYRRLHGTALPTVLVLEEAHTFVHRDLRSDSAPASGRLCCRVFERIAREGRKFGLELVLASQRPSEMSETVLAQCNTFLLHRLVNDRDQELVRKLVPEGHGDLLRELPSLPSRRTILLGWGAPAPVLVEVRELPDKQRPHSPDPRFWDVWTGEQPCDVDWSKIASDWQGIQTTAAQASDQQNAGREAAGP
jgi:DNA helicase HerA-like ATPase